MLVYEITDLLQERTNSHVINKHCDWYLTANLHNFEKNLYDLNFTSTKNIAKLKIVTKGK